MRFFHNGMITSLEQAIHFYNTCGAPGWQRTPGCQGARQPADDTICRNDTMLFWRQKYVMFLGALIGALTGRLCNDVKSGIAFKKLRDHTA